jgi:peptidoglycan hydrolase-like protein with peptidoglycan-binding domain
MNTYLLGCDILGEVTIPTVDQTYTDRATVLTVQRGLMARGYKLPKYGADGDYGEETAAAIRKFQKDMGVAVTGKIDYYVVAAFKNVGAGVSATAARAMVDKQPDKVTFEDEVITSTLAQTKNVTTAPQLKAVAAQVKTISTDSSVSPEVKAEAAAAQQAALSAVTMEQIKAAAAQLQAVTEKVKASKGMASWKIGLIAGGSAVAVVGAFWLVMRQRTVRAV